MTPKRSSAPAPKKTSERWRTWLAVGVLIAAGLAAYANSFAGVFLYDDFDAIRDNLHIRALWPPSEPLSLAMKHTADTVSGRPFLSLTFALNYALLGPDTVGYHSVNLAIHLLAALALFGLIRVTLVAWNPKYGSARALVVAATCALLWMLHPLHTSSVTYIAQRAESLAGLFFLLTLYCGARGHGRPNNPLWHGAAVTCCAFGMLTKETMATAPLLLLLHDAVFLSGSPRAALRRRPGFYLAIGAAWSILLVPLLLVLTDPNPRHDVLAGASRYTYALTQPEIILYYFRLLAWPNPLVLSYDWPAATSLTAVAPAAIGVGALVGATCVALVRRHPLGFAGAWFFLILAPTSTVVALSQRIMEHRLYLPSAAVLTVVVVGVERYLAHRRAEDRTSQQLAVAGVLIVALAYGATTFARNRDYANEEGFWRQNLAARPEGFTAALHLGRALLEQNRAAEALGPLALVVERQPDYDAAHSAIGRAYLAQGDLDRAIFHLKRAVTLAPEQALFHNNLGRAYALSGQPDLAQHHLEQALALSPKLSLAHSNLVSLHEERRDFSKAIDHLKRQIELAGPSPDLSLRLARLYEFSGDTTRAEAAYRELLDTNPNHLPALTGLGVMAARAGQLEQALPLMERAAELASDSVPIALNLASLYGALGRSAEARERLEALVDRADAPATAFLNLGILLEETGHRDAAVRRFREALEKDPNLESARLRLRALDGQAGSAAP